MLAQGILQAFHRKKELAPGLGAGQDAGVFAVDQKAQRRNTVNPQRLTFLAGSLYRLAVFTGWFGRVIFRRD